MDRNRFIQCMKSNVELSDKERRRIIRKSVESQPWKLKCTIAMEEFAELTQAISKQIRGYDNRIGLLEEMADAYICLEFLCSRQKISVMPSATAVVTSGECLKCAKRTKS